MRRGVAFAAVVLAMSAPAALASQGPSPVGGQTAALIEVYVSTAIPSVGRLIPFDQRAREESVEQLRRELKNRLPDKIAVLATKPADAVVTVDVLKRTATGNDYVLHLRVSVGEETWSLAGSNDDAHWSDTAVDAAEQIAEWVTLNKDLLAARRGGP